MHSIKGFQPKTHDQKNNQDFKSPVKTQDGRDSLIGMTLKNVKHPNANQPLFTKSFSKSDELSSTKSASAQLKLLSKKVEKRKEGKTNADFERKKAKLDCKQNKSNVPATGSLISKKDIKSKSACGKPSASFICKYCCRHFRSSELLQDHVSSHGSNPSYVCYVCGLEAQAFSSLMSHCVKHSRMKSNKNEKMFLKQEKYNIDVESAFHAQPKTIRCSQCKVSFPSTDKLASHFCSTGPQKTEYSCAYCGHLSSSIDDYRLHVLSHTVTPFLCLHCNFKGPTKKLLDKHYEVCKKRPKGNEKTVLKCKICKTVFKHRKLLNQHVKICDGTSATKGTYKSCMKCDTKFNNNADYDDHVRICEASKEPLRSNASSPIQNYETVKKGGSKAQINKVSKVESILCSRCGEILDKRGYEKHKQACVKKNKSTIHENAAVLCSTCGDIFHSNTLVEHQKNCQLSPERSKNEDLIKIEMDGDLHMTRRSARLVRRKSSYSEEKSVSSKCAKVKRFKKKPMKRMIVVKGRQSKVGKEIFKCVHCDLTFCSKSTLLRHKRMHSGNPYFSCKYCGKFFFRKDVYTRHEVNVHSKSSKVVFCCYYCKLYFGDPEALREHVLVTHKENAFLPIKPELLGNTNQDKAGLLPEIKREPGNDTIVSTDNNIEKNLNSVKNDHKVTHPLPSSFMISALKKCGVCFQTFVNVFEIEKHMQSHKNFDNSSVLSDTDCSSTLLGKTPSKSNHVSRGKHVSEPEMQPMVQAKKIPATKNKRLKSSTSQSVTSSIIESEQSTEPSIFNSDLNEPSTSVDISHLGTDQNDNCEIACKLCSKVFKSRVLLKSHEETKHKIMDWYKCLVCDTLGPKQEMLEHMFSHMFKVGTFVTNNEQSSLDSILPCLLNQDMKLNCNVHVSPTQDEGNVASGAMSMDTSDEVMDYELPQLTDYGSTNSSEHEDLAKSQKEEKRDDNILNAYVSVSENEKVADSVPREFDDVSQNSCAAESYISMETGHIIKESCEAKSPPCSIQEKCKNVHDRFEDIDCLSLKGTLAAEGEKAEKSSLLLDDNTAENTKFSQLRYLLENFKRNSSPETREDSNKEIDKSSPDDKDNPKYAQLRHLLKSIPINSLRNIKDNLNQLTSSQNQEQSGNDVQDAIKNLEDKAHDLSSPNTPDHSMEIFHQSLKDVESPSNKSGSCEKHKPQDLSSGVKTCLKFDINQSRGEFTESLLLSPKPTLESYNKLENTLEAYQSSQLQNKILDFSDLLIGDSTSTNEDNVFKCDETLNLPSSSCNQSYSPDKIFNFSSLSKNASPSELSKSSECNKQSSKSVNHLCSKHVSPNKSAYSFETKNTLSPCYTKTDTYATGFYMEKSYKDRHHMPKFFSSNYLCSVCDKPLKNSDELKHHYQSEHSDSPLPNNVCKSCYKTFSTTNECMKHSANCTKLHFRKNHSADNLKLPVTLQSLLAKNDPNRPQSYSPASPDSESSVSDILYDNVLNLSHNPFNS